MAFSLSVLQWHWRFFSRNSCVVFVEDIAPGPYQGDLETMTNYLYTHSDIAMFTTSSFIEFRIVDSVHLIGVRERDV